MRDMEGRLDISAIEPVRRPTDPSWTESFLAYLGSPEAVGQLILTVVAAGIAFAGAVWLVRHQLRHDRNLFRDQLAVEREFRRAEMRRGAAHRLGESLVAAAEGWGSVSNDEAYEILLDKSFHSRHYRTPGAQLAYEAHGIARRELDLDDAVIDLWRAKLWWWEAVQAKVDDPRVKSFPLATQKSVLFALADERMVVFDGALHELGVKLMRWDGENAIPSLAAEDLPTLPADRFRELADITLDKVIADRAKREADRARRAKTSRPATARTEA